MTAQQRCGSAPREKQARLAPCADAGWPGLIVAPIHGRTAAGEQLGEHITL